MDDDDTEELPPLTVRLESILAQTKQQGREVTEFAVGPLTWLDLAEELCPSSRCLSDVVAMKWRGVPIKKNLHPKGEENTVYFIWRAFQPKDLAVGLVG